MACPQGRGHLFFWQHGENFACIFILGASSVDYLQFIDSFLMHSTFIGDQLWIFF